MITAYADAALVKALQAGGEATVRDVIKCMRTRVKEMRDKPLPMHLRGKHRDCGSESG
jgi:hypothetical protein